MKHICYSPDSIERLQAINMAVSEQFGEEVALDTIAEIMDTIDLLSEKAL